VVFNFAKADFCNQIMELYDTRKAGGAKGSRTPDLLNAIQALSQLSYGPAQGGGI
jgi:hypothetical protein